MLRGWLALTGLVAVFATSFPSAAFAESIGFTLMDDSALPSTGTDVTVLDELTLEPISDARVSIGALKYRQGRSYIRRALLVDFSDEDGNVYFETASPEVPKTIQVKKEGYASITIMGVQTNRAVIYLKRLEQQIPEVLARGEVTGWKDRQSASRKPVYGGLVLRTLNAFDVLSFSMNSVISPLKDTIDVFGPRQIPSNFVLPEQSIPVLIGSVKVNKPFYRLPMRANWETRLSVIQGTIDSGDLTSIGGGGQMNPAAINKFTFNKIAVTDSVMPAEDFTLNIRADRGLSNAHDVSVTEPPFAADVLIAALVDLNGDRKVMIPTDIKAPITLSEPSLRAAKLQSAKPMKLRSTATALGSDRLVMAVATTRDLKKLSGIVQGGAGSSVRFGSFLAVEELADANTLPASIRLRAPSQGVAASILETQVTEGDRTRNFPVAYVYALPVAKEAVIPTPSLATGQTVKRYSTLQMEFAPDFNERAIDGQSVLTQLQRFGRATAKVGK